MKQRFTELYNQQYFEERLPGRDIKREESYLQEYASICKYIPEGKVLDVGCGMGNFLDIFDSSKWEKYGIEISEYACKIAKEKGIQLIDYDFQPDFFDLIVFRGVLQHLDAPLYSIQKCVRMLKKYGFMVFLATPNTGSIYYRIFQELPMLDPKLNFILPSDTMLKQILTNFGLKVVELKYPYIGSPYASLVTDHIKFLLRFLGVRKKFPFWRNMMECYARKVLNE